jgi:hypothetical protein
MIASTRFPQKSSAPIRVVAVTLIDGGHAGFHVIENRAHVSGAAHVLPRYRGLCARDLDAMTEHCCVGEFVPQIVP